MWFEFRQAVYDDLYGKLSTAVWDEIPDDVAELPCVVVGRPGGQQQGPRAVVWDLELPVYVLGRRQQAGGSEAETLAIVDDVFTALGGTRGTDSPATPVRVTPTVVVIAGQDVSGYVVTVDQPATTC